MSSQRKVRNTIIEVLDDSKVALLTTLSADLFPHSRPMALVGHEGLETLYFLTTKSAKTDEIDAIAASSVSVLEKRRYVVLRGRAEVTRDANKARQLWSRMMDVWFPEGPDGPDLRVLRFGTTDAELWDYTGARGLRFAAAAVRSLITHRPMGGDGAGTHAQLTL